MTSIDISIVNPVIDNGLNYKVTIQQELPKANKKTESLLNLLNTYRNKIDNIDKEQWKKVRYIVNKYDFDISKNIINRAFFKYWEMVNEFDIYSKYDIDNDVILHCAEAPGGFIQGTSVFLTRNFKNSKNEKHTCIDEDGFTKVTKKPKKDYKIYTISLNNSIQETNNKNLPTYNKNVLNSNICVTYGKDNTGDITNWNNVKYIKELSRKNFYFITADGGIDEGINYNNKEQLHYRLIMSEIYTALKLQSKNGHFILKMFDTFTDTSIHFLYLLAQCYENIHVYKPNTSRPTNSEKYIICKSFKLSDETRNKIVQQLEQRHQQNVCENNEYMSFQLFDSIPNEFVDTINKMNETIVSKQINYLCQALRVQCDNEVDSNTERNDIFEKWINKYKLY